MCSLTLKILHLSLCQLFVFIYLFLKFFALLLVQNIQIVKFILKTKWNCLTLSLWIYQLGYILTLGSQAIFFVIRRILIWITFNTLTINCNDLLTSTIWCHTWPLICSNKGVWIAFSTLSINGKILVRYTSWCFTSVTITTDSSVILTWLALCWFCQYQSTWFTTWWS